MVAAMRETKAQKATRFSLLLADYDEQSKALRKLSKRVDEMKAEIRKEIDPGTYGEWIVSTGTPREILDQPAAKNALTAAGIEIPTKMTDAPIIVSHVAATK
jgi:hypothetical protein